ncbi:beta family protein [Paraburkholderia sp. J67]|uniref:beta family protein n=1 Tax=Paraburkholderia sp. J67 TaxID=2805435 RepID=UPI002ABD4377|nr:beta family protein [Paraburkholderia sp. J67]
MMDSKVLYCPALRMKTGELNGVRELASNVAAHVIPRFIVPPPSEREDNQPELFVLDNTPDIGGVLARHWHGRPAFIDATHLLRERGKEDLAAWLPQMFARARSVGVWAIPMALLTDLGTNAIEAFKASIDSAANLKFCVCVSSGEMVDPDFGATLSAAIEQLGLSASECAVIADFYDSDFTTPDHVAPIVAGALEQLQDLGQWKHIIFQGTHYPEKNPADHGSSKLWPRNEWAAWQQAVRFDPATAEHMIFGDYAADCSKMVFGGSGGVAIRHYRYATASDWLIVRGAQRGSDREIMREICTRVLESGLFAGSSFSAADTYIERTAQGLDGPGNSTMWRQVNTTHHITRAVVDVAKVRGISIAELPLQSVARQQSLLEDEV